MGRALKPALTCALLALLILPLVAAHGDEAPADHLGMDAGGAQSAHDAHSAMQMASLGEYNVEPSYWRHSEYSGLMLAHVLLMVVSWVFVLPVGEWPVSRRTGSN